LQKGSGVQSKNAGIYFDSVVEFRRCENFEAGSEGATFGVIGRVHQSGYTRLDDRAGTHGARLERDIKSGVRETIIAQHPCGLANHDDLCMRRRIVITNGAIPGSGQDAFILDENGANGDFAGFSRSASFLKGELHEMQIVRHKRARE